jgi:hypothetical protein
MADNETERERLARAYSEKSDSALSELAADAGNLTDAARQVLLTEMTSRGMTAELGTLGNTSSPESEPAKISGPLLMVKQFSELPKALVAKSVLESAGIDCFLADENMMRLGGGLYSNLFGGAKLMVRPEDLETATQLLNQTGTDEIELEEETALDELLRKESKRNPSGDGEK